MKILFATSECSPLAKVGGLADVAGSLPKALKKQGSNVSVILPFYGVLKEKNAKLFKKNIKLFFDKKEQYFDLYKTFLPKSKVPLYLVKNNDYFQGDVYLTDDASSGGSNMEAARFLFFSKAVVKTAEIINFDIIHCHDWHVGIIPFLIKKEKINIKTLLTIHNIGYQGIFPYKVVNQFLNTDFKEEVNCLKQGILNADFINTVSENYAKEILTPEFGFGLEKYLAERKNSLTGILNGIDLDQFNPKKDTHIAKNYNINSLKNKVENKKSLQKKSFKKNDLSIPIVGIISRLAEQKGFDLIKEIMPKLLEKNIQIVLLGKGDKEYESFFQKQAKENPQKIFVEIGFNAELAQQIYAGSDIFLMPSRFEPCGLGQIIAMQYGTVPIVRATGGLKDTVKQNKTGFLFKNYTSSELLSVIEKTLKAYEGKKWLEIQKNGMKKDFSWNKSAEKYLKLYKKIKSS